MKFTPTIGLEIHSELRTNSKMFCSSPNDPDETRPNFNVCPVCMGHPGTLPVINKEAVRKVIKTGLALNCSIPAKSKFDRKNYFYPDLPKGYQISQYDMPLCQKGYLEVSGRRIGITRVHLEEDTGRLIHEEVAGGKITPEVEEKFKKGDIEEIYRQNIKEAYTLVDFNRAGIPLMELVTEPDITSGKEARQFAEELQLILRYLDVSSADMEKGQMRVEVNISLKPEKSDKLGTKVEIKNLNSFRSVERAIDYEMKRQEELLNQKKKIIQETRGWNDQKGETFSQREKEEAHDYRYFPEPDLPTLTFGKDFIEEIRAEVPELPKQKKERFGKEYGLDEKTAETFVSNKDLSEYFEKVVSEFENWIKEEEVKEKISAGERKKINKLASNYIISDIKGLLGDRLFVEKDFKITPENFAEFIKMIYKNEISSRIAKQVLKIMFETGADPSHVIGEHGLAQVSDESEIEVVIKQVLSENPKAVEDYKKGKLTSFQFLIGKAMAATRGKANPQTLQKVLKDALSK